MVRFRSMVSRTRDGTFAIRLSEDEREVLITLLPQLREMLVGGDDPGLRRLFPPAYANDPERDAEYQGLVHDDLLERRLAALDTVEETLAAKVVDEDQLTRWMGAVNDLRLVLGTKLDVSEELDYRDLDPDDPAAPAYALYNFLTTLLSDIIDSLAGW